MNDTWNPESQGVAPPSGRLVRGRALRRPLPQGFNPLLHSTCSGENQRRLPGKAAGFFGRTSGKHKVAPLTRFAKHGLGLKLNGSKSPVGRDWTNGDCTSLSCCD